MNTSPKVHGFKPLSVPNDGFLSVKLLEHKVNFSPMRIIFFGFLDLYAALISGIYCSEVGNIPCLLDKAEAMKDQF